MKAEFEKQLNQLLGVRKERTLLMTDERYNELVAETKEANERRSRGLELSGIHYRRLKRFDVMTIGGREKLVQKNEKGHGSEKIYFCMASEMFDVVHSAHLKIGHKKEKGMELELKRKYCNITREVIAIYLSLCEDCALKKKYRGKGLSVKLKSVSELDSCCQIDIINMEAEPDGMYKFILNYQDPKTKFLVLRPLATKTPEEVADVLFDIFCLIGVPSTLLCGNEHDYCNKILHVLSKNWNVKLFKSEPHQDTVNRVSQDIHKSLTEWMSDNQTRTWASNLRIIQRLKNLCFNPSIQRTPHEALFGQTQRSEKNSSLDVAIKVKAEKEVRGQLTLLKQKLNEVNEITKKMIKNLESPPQREDIKEPKDTETKCLTCNKALTPEVFCWKCSGPLHFNCALTNDNSENPFCQSCASKTAVQIHRRGRKRRLEEPPDQVAQQECPAFIVGDKVMVSIPEIDNENSVDFKASARQNIGTKSAILERLFHRNESHLTGSISKAVSPSTELQLHQMTNGSKSKSNKSKSNSSKKSSKHHTKSTQCNI